MTLAQAWGSRGGLALPVEVRIIVHCELMLAADTISNLRGLYPVAAIDVGLGVEDLRLRVPARRPPTPRAGRAGYFM